jgi:hypothetical protein
VVFLNSFVLYLVSFPMDVNVAHLAEVVCVGGRGLVHVYFVTVNGTEWDPIR